MSIFKSKISIFKKKKNLGAKKYLGAKSVFLRKIENLGAKLVFLRAKIIMFPYLSPRSWSSFSWSWTTQRKYNGTDKLSSW